MAPSYPAGIPPPLGRAPRATKGGSVPFSDLGFANKNFPGPDFREKFFLKKKKKIQWFFF
jgi:hypothetical protein